MVSRLMSYLVVNVLSEIVVDQILLVNPILNTLRQILGVHFKEHFFQNINFTCILHDKVAKIFIDYFITLN